MGQEHRTVWANCERTRGRRFSHVVGFDATAPDPLQLSPTSFTGWCWDAIKWMPHESAMVQGEEPAFQ